MMEDIAILTGASFVSQETGRKLDSVTIDDLGRADRIIADKDNTTIVGGKGDSKELQERIKQIRTQIEQGTSDYDKDKMKERLAKLSGGVAVIKVGAATEAELKELKLRVEDAVNATKAAVEEGNLELQGDENTGARILHESLEKPARLLIRNTGADDGKILAEIERRMLEEKNTNVGYNVVKMSFVDMVLDGIIDPAKVARSALQNAVSAATMILTTECLVAEAPKKDEPKPGNPGMGMDMDGMM